MPNLLAHYGAQGLVTRGLFRRADVKWILLGAFIPDLPWIIRRAAETLLPGLDPYTLRLYVMLQASLLFGLVLAAFFALLSSRPALVFGVLSLNVLLHLILDALQEKWGTGVHLLAPLRWETWSADLFAMEGWITYGLTVLGLGFCAWEWRRRERGANGNAGSGGGGRARTEAFSGLPPRGLSPARLGAAGVFLGAYFLLPLPFLDDILASDAGHVRTLAEREDRPGRPFVMDRNPYLSRPEGDVIVPIPGDTLRVDGPYFDRSVIVSLRGTFVDEETLRVHEIVGHRPFFRDGASYLGLIVLAAFWLSAARSRLLASGTGPRPPPGTERPLSG